MQQDNNNSENKLRQLENQQLPDLSRMDEHWTSMQLMLQPTAVTGHKKTRISKWLWAIGLLILIVATTLFTRRDNDVTINDIAVKTINQPAATIPDTALPTRAQAMQVPVNPVYHVIFSEGNGNDENDLDNTVIDLPVQLSSKDSTLITIAPGKQKMLDDLLSELAKRSQEFRIDNSRDTILFAAEGSSLFIPAGSLGGSSSVKISLREFYKTSDIILNKLSTTSNGEQLITGGMVHISATVNDKPVTILPGKPIKLYMADTSRQMEQMQLFTGEEKEAGKINWINSGQNFLKLSERKEIWVLNTANNPIKTIERKKGIVGIFVIADKPALSRNELRELLKQKYGYYKVRFVRWRNRKSLSTEVIPGITYSDFPLGDSTWVEENEAKKYQLEGARIRTVGFMSTPQAQVESIMKRSFIRQPTRPGMDTIPINFQYSLETFQNKYSVDINSLGWINCDRFYKDAREKTEYIVNLNDSAVNFYTMLVFVRMRSMMAGYPSGNKIMFANLPLGEPVRIISIGINKNGETVMAMNEAVISKDEFAGLQFEAASSAAIKSSLSKTD